MTAGPGAAGPRESVEANRAWWDAEADEYYLEHGAFWAIGALSLVMYLKAAGVETPEVVSGTIGAALIGLGFLSSVRHNRAAAKSGG